VPNPRARWPLAGGIHSLKDRERRTERERERERETLILCHRYNGRSACVHHYALLGCRRISSSSDHVWETGTELSLLDCQYLSSPPPRLLLLLLLSACVACVTRERSLAARTASRAAHWMGQHVQLW